MPTITSMNAKEIIPRSAIENGTLLALLRMRVAGTEPAPMKTRKPVPRASANQRWATVFCSMRVSLGRTRGSSRCSTMSNVVSVKLGRTTGAVKGYGGGEPRRGRGARLVRPPGPADRVASPAAARAGRGGGRRRADCPLGAAVPLTWVVALACAVLVPVAAELTGRRNARRDGLP